MAMSNKQVIAIFILGIALLLGAFWAGLFGLLIIANSGIGIIQEIRAKRTLDKLAIVGQTRPRVRRDGTVMDFAGTRFLLRRP